MSGLAVNYTMRQPRSSTETDRQHLLADSVAPSTRTSIYEAVDGDRTPRAHSPSPSKTDTSADSPPASSSQDERRNITPILTSPQPYRGFPSQAHYLAALEEWADSKRYVQYSQPLVGFYGLETLQEYASRPPVVQLGLRKKWRNYKERKASKGDTPVVERRNTVS
ncbi:Hypothetical protein R9X50_00695200 [Acrodontium crateriforme]|uniref:Uncharacterized protein n=1 Tax=Acrodontium crateriforme TaxID=150365 RepID=A0AAQ3MDM8_9PEZI|nr:Hypothetical protein R9X50_00695200 [Acrodontium crateriforme]